MGHKTFIGGVHPYDGKELSKDSPIKEVLPKGDMVYPVSQHIGAPAKPVVAVGDTVLKGQMIAEAGGFVSSPIYSSVSGKVKAIEKRRVAVGDMVDSIVIENDGMFTETTYESVEDVTALSKEEIIEKVKNAGVVGMGGAGFPTHVKLSPKEPDKIEYIIANCAECEPYITADYRLMMEHADEILVGLNLLMKAAKVEKGYIGIEDNKPAAIKLFEEKTANDARIEIVPLAKKYPQGGEKQLIDAVTKRQVASGALPISTGAVVQNVGTAFAVYEAVQKNKPLFERVITVTGKSVARPSNFLARIGTPMKQLIDACGGLPEDTGKVIGGGPMMGKALVNIDVPTAKGSSGILIMNRKEAKRGEAQTCIRCAKCVSACPMGLEPYLLGALSENGDFETMEKERIMDCIECGSCQFTCPANRPLLDYCRLGKGKVGAMIRARQAKK